MSADPSAGDVPFDALLAHREWVRRLARRLVSDPNAADDVEQETWRMALERPPRHGGSLRAWLGAVVRNAARMAGRSRSRRAAHEATAPARPGGAAPDDVVAEAELQHRLVGHVLALDEPYRGTVLARWFEGLEAQEIAARGGVPVETVRTRLKRAVARLREEMAGDLGDDRRAWALLLLGADGVPRGPGTGATAGATTGTTAALTGAAGGMAMGAAMKAAAAAVVLACLGTGWWLVDRELVPSGEPGRDVADVPPATDTAGPHTPAATRAEAPAADAPRGGASAASPGEPALFVRADRDLDLHGVVVRADGSPVVGAAVTPLDYAWRRAAMRNFAALFTSAAGPSATTDAQGAFSIRLRRGDERYLRVAAEGLATRESGGFGAGERVRIVMTAPVALRVNVRDEAGAPVAAARLWLFGPSKDDAPWIDAHGATDAAGACVFADLPAGAKARLMRVAGVSDFDPVRVELPAEGERTIDVVAPAGRTLRGRVTDADGGSGIAGAVVADRYTGLGAVTTDSGGAFELRGWTGKSTDTLHCRAAGYAPAALRVTAEGDLAFVLRRGFATAGRVVDAEGRPVAAALVSVEAPDGRDAPPSVGYATTGADGGFRVADLSREALHSVAVTAPGFGRATTRIGPPPAGTEVFDLRDIALAPGRVVGGVVRLSDGTPSPGAAVTLTPAGAGGVRDREFREQRRTDDLGRFRFADVAPGSWLAEARMADGSNPSVTANVPADRDVLDLALPPAAGAAGTITVTVTDDAGTPLAGINVIPVSRSQVRPVRTDAAGRASLANPPDAPITGLHVGPQVADQPYLLTPQVHVDPGKSAYSVVLERGAWVTCLVLDPDGNPFPQVTVGVEPAGRASSFTFTGADGRVRIALPKSGTFALTLGQTVRGIEPGLDARLEGVTAQSGEVVLRCTRVATDRTATIRVVDADGAPAEGVEVVVWPAQTHGKGTATDAGGRAHYTGLPARECTVHLSKPRPGDLYPDALTFVPDGSEVVLRLPRVAHVTGTVTWSSGGTVAGAYVQVLIETGADPLFCSCVTTDADGRFSVPVHAEGDRRFQLTVSAPGADRKPVHATRTVTAADRDLSIVLQR